MRKIICKKEYDTQAAKLIKKYTYGAYGDTDGYEETLYQTPDGFYFLYVSGGPDSPYPDQNILRIAKSNVDKWLETH